MSISLVTIGMSPSQRLSHSSRITHPGHHERGNQRRLRPRQSRGKQTHLTSQECCDAYHCASQAVEDELQPHVAGPPAKLLLEKGELEQYFQEHPQSARRIQDEISSMNLLGQPQQPPTDAPTAQVIRCYACCWSPLHTLPRLLAIVHLSLCHNFPTMHCLAVCCCTQQCPLGRSCRTQCIVHEDIVSKDADSAQERIGALCTATMQGFSCK